MAGCAPGTPGGTCSGDSEDLTYQPWAGQWNRETCKAVRSGTQRKQARQPFIFWFPFPIKFDVSESKLACRLLICGWRPRKENTSVRTEHWKALSAVEHAKIILVSFEKLSSSSGLWDTNMFIQYFQKRKEWNFNAYFLPFLYIWESYHLEKSMH